MRELTPFKIQTAARSEKHLLRLLPLLLSLAGLLTSASLANAAGSAPPLMLAKVYQPGVALADYWVSEKYDGIRGYWDGRQLLTRGGLRIAVRTGLWPTGRPRQWTASCGLAKGNFKKYCPLLRNSPPMMQPGKACASWCLICLRMVGASQTAFQR